MKFYILFRCDTWKSSCSKRLVCVSNEFKDIAAAINNEVKRKGMEVDSLAKNAKFEHYLQEEGIDIENITLRDIHDINTRLSYGFIEVLEKGEILD